MVMRTGSKRRRRPKAAPLARADRLRSALAGGDAAGHPRRSGTTRFAPTKTSVPSIIQEMIERLAISDSWSPTSASRTRTSTTRSASAMPPRRKGASSSPRTGRAALRHQPDAASPLQPSRRSDRRRDGLDHSRTAQGRHRRAGGRSVSVPSCTAGLSGESRHGAAFLVSWAAPRLSEFQAEVSATRRAPDGERRARALELRRTYFTSAPMQQVVAVDLLYLLRDCTDWETTLAFINELPESMRRLPSCKSSARSPDRRPAIISVRSAPSIRS